MVVLNLEEAGLHHIHHRAAGLFYRQLLGFGSLAFPANRTCMTLGIAGCTHQRSELHQGPVMKPWTVVRNQLGGELPESAKAGHGIDGNTQVIQPRKHTGNIGVHGRHRSVECEAGQRPGGVPSNPWQPADQNFVSRQYPPILCANRLCGPVQVPSTGVIAKPLPKPEHLLLLCDCKTREIGKPFQPAFIEWNHCGNLRLLEHEFRHQNRVGIQIPTPWQIAPVEGEPVPEFLLDFGHVHGGLLAPARI